MGLVCYPQYVVTFERSLSARNQFGDTLLILCLRWAAAVSQQLEACHPQAERSKPMRTCGDGGGDSGAQSAAGEAAAHMLGTAQL